LVISTKLLNLASRQRERRPAGGGFVGFGSSAAGFCGLIRAARAFLDWNIVDLTNASGVSDTTIRSIEKADGEPQISGGLESTLDYRIAGRLESVQRIERALVDAGITFLHANAQGPGIRGKS
jgi:hypothetical protein